ncbi:MAG: vacuolar-type H+-ATPase subunit H [Ruminococcus sp.]|nr:vacuolar-type H+-ATPase subunit H [Ruminococcus sp.]
MNIEEILEDMDDTLDEARPIPFATHKVVVDADRLRELINDIRLNIPAEIKRAKLIDFDCERIINDAKAKAEQIVQDAELHAQDIVQDAEREAQKKCSEQAIQQAARQRGADMLARAQYASNEIRAGAADYVNRVLGDTEACLTASLQEIQKVKARMEESRKKPKKRD